MDWKDADKANAMVAFTAWALTAGQAQETALGYAPLPDAVATNALDELHQVTANGTRVWP